MLFSNINRSYLLNTRILVVHMLQLSCPWLALSSIVHAATWSHVAGPTSSLLFPTSPLFPTPPPLKRSTFRSTSQHYQFRLDPLLLLSTWLRLHVIRAALQPLPLDIWGPKTKVITSSFSFSLSCFCKTQYLCRCILFCLFLICLFLIAAFPS